MGVVDGHGPGEEGVRGVEDLGRENGDVAPVEGADLVGHIADGGRGGHQERPGGPAAGGAPGAHGLDRGLEQADGGPQGTGDEVELVLDDEVRGPQAGGGADASGRQGAPGAVPSAVGECAAVEVAGAVVVEVGHIAVALAAAGDVPEQRGGVPLAGQAGELVHGGDDEGRREAVDLLIGGQDRQAVGHVAVALGEGALAELVGAAHDDAVGARADGADDDVIGTQGQAAPGAVAQLEGGEAVPRPAVALAQALELLLGLLDPFGGHGGADPQADAEGLGPPGGGVLAAGELGGAHEGGGALELLGGEQAQGVAHEDGDAGAPVDGAVGRVEEPLAAADGEGVGGQSQVGLGLAAAGGEEEELGGGQVAGAAGQGGVGQGRQLHEDEGELEDAPVVGIVLLEDAGPGLLDAEAGVDGAGGGDLGADALVGHDPVHEGEAAAGLAVGQEVVEALGKLTQDLAGLGQGLRAGAPQVLGQGGHGGLLLVEPGRVGDDDGLQGASERVRAARVVRTARVGGVGRLRGRGGQGAHIELGAGDAGSGGLGRLDGRHPGGADPEGATRRGLARPGGAQAPIGRAGASDGELQAVAVLELEAGVLRAGGRPHAGSRWEQGVVDGQEDVALTRVHVDPGLEHPGRDGDPLGGGPVVAQGELNEVAARRPSRRRGVQVGVDAQSDVAVEHVVLGAARGEVRQGQAKGAAVGDAAVAGDAGAPAPGGAGRSGGGVLVVAAGGLVGAPPDAHGDGLQLGGVGGDLKAQSHGGGDHEAAAHRLVVGVLAGVLLGDGARGLLLHAGDGGAGRRRRLGIVGDAGQARGGDAAQKVALIGRGGEDLGGAVGRTDEFAFEHLDEPGAGGGRGGAEFAVEDVGGAVVAPGRVGVGRGRYGERGGIGLRCQGSPPERGSERPSRTCGRERAGSRGRPGRTGRGPRRQRPRRRRGGGSPPGAGRGSRHG